MKVEIIAEIAQGYEGNPKLAELLVKGAIIANADDVIIHANELGLNHFKTNLDSIQNKSIASIFPDINNDKISIDFKKPIQPFQKSQCQINNLTIDSISFISNNQVLIHISNFKKSCML